MKVIGLTGGTGTGKSEVARLLKEHFNAYIIIADTVGHNIIAPGTQSYNLIVDYWGTEILDADRQINRKLLGNIVFNNRAALDKLNSFTHPYIYQSIKEEIELVKKRNTSQLIVVEAAALIEANFISLVDEVWYVYANLQKRIERLTQYRGYSIEKINSIVNSQLSEEVFREKCKYVIDNSYTSEETLQQLKVILQ